MDKIDKIGTGTVQTFKKSFTFISVNLKVIDTVLINFIPIDSS